jgi:uncharacterized phage-associated protein
MIIDHSRDKLMNAMVFFAKNTNYCGKIKMYKLLYFLDFEHYKEIGRSVTGLEYFAWKKGPVPKSLGAEIDFIDTDASQLGEHLEIVRIPTQNNDLQLFVPKREFNRDHITKREFRIMDSLASEYRDTLAKDMIEATHLENQPWGEIYNKQGRKFEPIPYELALRKHEKEVMLEYIRDQEEFTQAYS